MCGIVAVFNNIDSKYITKSMLNVIKHRGTENNIINGTNYSMGTVRLPIVDKEISKQPITYKEYIIIFNGELYNYKELRKKYLKDIELRTNGDAEVFLVLWIKYGAKILKEFRGMYGAIIYNRKTKKFIAVRDYLGIKPLYYIKNKNSYFFASEYKAFNNIKEFNGQVMQVLPRHYFDGKKQVEYEKLSFKTKNNNEYDLTNTIYELMENSITRRISTEPTGVLLSGGIDSSIIAYHVYKHISSPLYTVGFKDCEDIEYAKLMAKHVDSKNHRIYLLNESEIIDLIDTIIWYTENYNKYTIINAIPAYFAIKMAKEDGIKVLLCGEGSDELFGGYDFLYNYYKYNQLEKNIKNSLLQIHRTECLRMDRVTMLHTIEGRAPFLDKDFVKYAISIKRNWKYKDDKEKYILRKTYEKYLPKEIVYRKKNNFYKSTGVEKIIEDWADMQIGNEEFHKLQKKYAKWLIRSKEELIFFLKWKAKFPKLFEQGADYFKKEETSVLNMGFDLRKKI